MSDLSFKDGVSCLLTVNQSIMTIPLIRGGRAQPLQFTFKKTGTSESSEKSRGWVGKPRLVSQVSFWLMVQILAVALSILRAILILTHF